MRSNLADRLRQLQGVTCTAVDAIEYEAPPKDSIYAVGTSMSFSDGTRLSAQFWRLLKGGRPLVSIFDHRQKYGLPAPIDAVQILRSELQGKSIVTAEMDDTTADLRFSYESDLRLDVFNFTAFEIWEITFADGTGERSNYALQE